MFNTSSPILQLAVDFCTSVSQNLLKLLSCSLGCIDRLCMSPDCSLVFAYIVVIYIRNKRQVWKLCCAALQASLRFLKCAQRRARTESSLEPSREGSKRSSGCHDNQAVTQTKPSSLALPSEVSLPFAKKTNKVPIFTG